MWPNLWQFKHLVVFGMKRDVLCVSKPSWMKPRGWQSNVNTTFVENCFPDLKSGSLLTLIALESFMISETEVSRLTPKIMTD
jgi:hypothetical protein